MKVRLIGKTSGLHEYQGKSLDEIIVGLARVSSKRSDLFASPEKLLRHCVMEQHWSVFDQCDLTFEIFTSRAMSHQLIRHKMHFQEFSLRYAENTEIEPIELRRQAVSNRQSSTDVINPDIYGTSAQFVIDNFINMLLNIYEILIETGVSRETARMILPLATQTKLNAKATLRQWITFLNARLHHTAQKEIRLVAECIKDAIISECPIISQCFFNFEDAYHIHFLERLVLEKYGVYSQVRQSIIK